jgi:hypothetical protein
MCRESIFLVSVVLLLGMVGTASAIDLKVDFAQMECDGVTIIPETAKPGWWLWAPPGWWDMYSHDCMWENGGGSKPTDSGIDGTGIHAAVTLICEGDLGLKASGLTGALGGGVCPTDSTVHEPICNTWLQAVDWPEFEWSSIQLALHDLPAGEYTLYSYHNHFGCYRGDEGEYTPVTCDCLCNPAPPMPEIRAMSCKEARELPYQAADPWSKLFPGIDWITGPWPEGVTSIQEAYNVQPQQVTTDAELVPSVIKFRTDGSPVLVLYKAGCCEPDPVRPGRVGGRGILNAFRLVLSGEMPLLPASGPRPPDGAEDVEPSVVLSWSAGENATSHDVYFGTSFDSVSNADILSSEYRGPQDLDANSYDPCGFLELGVTYYWRIDEVNDPNTAKGQVWSFAVRECILLDDMESYNDDTNSISDTWQARPYPDSNNAASVYLQKTFFHGGEQAMDFVFESYLGTYFTVTRMYSTAQDWTAQGVHHLSLWFRGYSFNSAGQMYVTLKDGSGHSAAVAYDGDANDIKEEEWQEWNILLQDFGDGDVNLTDVRELAIDVDNFIWAGMICFDDIRLYGARCIPDFQPAGDITGDCFVNFKDFSTLANQWLKSPGTPSADIAPEPPDSFVDTLDLAVLAADWLEGFLCP